jgi:hypothetical protein
VTIDQHHNTHKGHQQPEKHSSDEDPRAARTAGINFLTARAAKPANRRGNRENGDETKMQHNERPKAFSKLWGATSSAIGVAASDALSAEVVSSVDHFLSNVSGEPWRVVARRVRQHEA